LTPAIFWSQNREKKGEKYMSKISPFLDAMNSVSQIKKVETVLPIARMTVNMTPLVTGDHVALQTAITSPKSFDRDLCKVLLARSEFVGEHATEKKINFNEFTDSISNIDKLSLIWGLYKASYDNLSDEREIICKNENCKEKIKVPISMDDLIHEDTFTVWDKTDDNDEFISFNKYRYVITIERDDYIYEFNSRIPSIMDNNRMLGMLSTDALQHNLDTIGSVFTKPQHMTNLVDAVRLSSKSKKIDTVETTNLDEMLLSFQNYLPDQVSTSFFKKYGEHFDMYTPKFYYNATCPVCNNKFKHTIDLETEFFLTALYGDRGSI